MCANHADVHLRRVNIALAYSHQVDALVTLPLPKLNTHFSLKRLSKLSKIIFARQEEMLLYTNGTMQGNLDVMEKIAFKSHEENRNISQIADRSEKDSRMLKWMALIATTYLPASLVAVSYPFLLRYYTRMLRMDSMKTIFSSSLIQLRQSSETSNHLIVAREFWIYVLVTILLTGVTIAILLCLKKQKH